MKTLIAALLLAVSFGAGAQAATQINGNVPAWVVDAFDNTQ